MSQLPLPLNKNNIETISLDPLVMRHLPVQKNLLELDFDPLVV